MVAAWPLYSALRTGTGRAAVTYSPPRTERNRAEVAVMGYFSRYLIPETQRIRETGMFDEPSILSNVASLLNSDAFDAQQPAHQESVEAGMLTPVELGSPISNCDGKPVH